MPGAAQISAFGCTYLFVFNTRRPPFDDRRVRLALNLAVEREAITDRLLAVGNPPAWGVVPAGLSRRSEEHTSELQSLMRISYAVFCLKKKKHATKNKQHST